MKILLAVTLTAMGTHCGNAQVSAAVRALPSGMAEIRVRNDNAATLVAFAARIDSWDGIRTPEPTIVYGDSAVDVAASELAPGEERKLEWGLVRGPGKPGAVPLQGIETAAIFADGSTWGDASLVGRIVTRRRCMLQAVEASIEMLVVAGKHNVPRAQLISQFRVMESSVYHWYLPREQQVGREVYRDLIEKLEALPETPFGSAFPPTSFVEEQTAALNRKRALLSDSRPSLSGKQ